MSAAQDLIPAPPITQDDRGQPQLANFSYEQIAKLTDAERASFKEQLVRGGFDAATVEAKFTAPKALADEFTKGMEIQQPLRLDLDGAKHPALSPSEQRILADNLRRFWTGTPEELAAAIEGTTKPESTEAASDPRSDEERAFDREFAGLQPSEYDLRGLFLNRGVVPVENVAALDAELRGALSEMRVPAMMAKGIAGELLDSATRYGEAERQSPAALQSWRLNQNVLLDRLSHGAPRDVVLGLAAFALGKINEGTRAMLLEEKALESAGAVMQLALQGGRLLMREQMAARRT